MNAALLSAKPGDTVDFSGVVELWQLSETADEPGPGRPVTAKVRVGAGGGWTVLKAGFKTDPVPITTPPATIHISLKEDAPGTLKDGLLTVRLKLLLDVKVTFPPLPIKALLDITLTNDADLKVQKPVKDGPPKDIVLKVKRYDPTTGEFALAGQAQPSGGVPDDMICLRIAGTFTPPL